MATFTFLFLFNDGLVWRYKTVPRAWNYVTRDARAFNIFFVVFKNSKSSFSDDNMPVYVIDVFIENATKNGLN